jgi:hypothetical protein
MQKDYHSLVEICESFTVAGAAPQGAKKLYTTTGEQIRQISDLTNGEKYVAATDDFIAGTYGKRKNKSPSKKGM